MLTLFTCWDIHEKGDNNLLASFNLDFSVTYHHDCIGSAAPYLCGLAVVGELLTVQFNIYNAVKVQDKQPHSVYKITAFSLSYPISLLPK